MGHLGPCCSGRVCGGCRRGSAWPYEACDRPKDFALERPEIAVPRVRGERARRGLLIPGQKWETTQEEPQIHGPEIGLFLGGRP